MEDATRDYLDEVIEDIVGLPIEEAETDESGTYFAGKHWVSSKIIVAAIAVAFEAGREYGVRLSARARVLA